MEVFQSDNIRNDNALFESIADDLLNQGYSVKPNALPAELCENLKHHIEKIPSEQFISAGVGRAQQHTPNNSVRNDKISWINDESSAGQQWLAWASQLQNYLNRRLLLGLFSFESHFAHYAPGDFYKRHLDAFKGDANRIVSIVIYLNSDWLPKDGGEFVLYQNENKDKNDQEGLKVLPTLGTIAVFLSEDFPHEVLPANRNRYSIAGWFRVNSSVSQRVDPPR